MKSILRIRRYCWRGSGGSAVVDQILEFFARLEIGDPLCGHFDLFACFWIAADACIALAYTEASKAANLEFVPCLERLDDALEQCIDNDLRVLPREFRNLGYFLNQVCLGHLLLSPLFPQVLETNLRFKSLPAERYK